MNQHTTAASSPKCTFENLEDRLLMKAPRPATILTSYFDNRGSVFMTVSVALDPTTLSRKTAAIYLPGADQQFGTADDVRQSTAVGYRKGRLTLRANIPLNTPYRVKLNASVIKDVNGKALDGNFNGDGLSSGNGVAGGDFDIVTSPTSNRKYRVRFNTVAGYINVGLYKNVAATVTNFLHYANEAAWDGTFFHRSTRDATSNIQVIQGGGFNVVNGVVDSVHSHTGIATEGVNSNTKGTIAMANTGQPNSNTNQWFFNVNDNSTLNPNYSVFGIVLDAESQATIEAINNLQIVDATGGNQNSPFGELPVIKNDNPLKIPGDLAMIDRVAILMNPTATPNVTPSFVTAPRTSTPLVTPAAPVPLFATTEIDDNSLFENS